MLSKESVALAGLVFFKEIVVVQASLSGSWKSITTIMSWRVVSATKDHDGIEALAILDHHSNIDHMQDCTKEDT
uniref:Uncharacterized protein n=1 Tax=Physcomitrium patens TaxID=3218 RepID=A0A2K1K0F7_PHYPA|nr:hypothetical protein PHYPA_014376 [Physcomitrium patens]